MRCSLIFAGGFACLVVLVAGCASGPQKKKATPKFNEWGSYEGKHFDPLTGTVTAIDKGANTITIGKGKSPKVFNVTASTRIIHEATDVTLAELPLNTTVKYTLSDDGTQLLTVWYGHRLNTTAHAGAAQHKDKNSFF